MTVLVALDSFKGSLSAREASEALAQGIRLERPDEEVIVLPVADGGDGLIDWMVSLIVSRMIFWLTVGKSKRYWFQDPMGKMLRHPI